MRPLSRVLSSLCFVLATSAAARADVGVDHVTHVAPAADGAGPATVSGAHTPRRDPEATYCEKHAGYKCHNQGNGKERCHLDASCNPAPAANATARAVRVHAICPGGHDGFGSQFLSHLSVFASCRAVPDDGCCYIHRPIRRLEHGVDAEAAEAATGLRSDARCASWNPLAPPKALTPKIRYGAITPPLADPAVRRELRRLYDDAPVRRPAPRECAYRMHVRRGDVGDNGARKDLRRGNGACKVATNEAYVCLAASIRRRDALAKICVFSEGSPENFGALAGAPGVELVLGGDALETFQHLVTAPYLFISHSTFSLSAAVLATQAKIFSAPFNGFASQLTSFWGECERCSPPRTAANARERHDPWARFGLSAAGAELPT